MDLVNALVIGVNGGVGRLIARELASSGVSVIGLDIHRHINEATACAGYICSNVLEPTAVSVAAVRESQCVVLCLPANVALGCIKWVMREASPDSLIVDTLSIKTDVAGIVQRFEKRFEYLSINPLFAPGLGFERRHVAAVLLREGPLSSKFMELIESWGATLLLLSADLHDKNMAALQVTTHIALISYGLVLEGLEYKPCESHELWTPPHKLLLCLLARLTTFSPEVYWEIQRSNPFARAARELFIETMKQLNSTINSNSQDEFEKTVSTLRSFIGSDAEVLAKTCSDLLASNAFLDG